MGESIGLLFFLHDLAPFGAQRAVLYTIKHLPRGEFSVTVCSFGSDMALAGEFRAAGAEVVALEARRYLDIAAWYRLVRLISRTRPGIVHTTLPELSVPVRLLALFLAGTRVVHGIQNPFSSEPWYWRLLNLLTAPLCAAFVFSSRGLMRHELEGRGSLRTRCAAVPNGVAPVQGDKGLRGELDIGGDKVVACSARLVEQKGQDILIRAAAGLRDRGKPVTLLLAGDGDAFARLRSLAAGLGISGKVLFLGRRTDIGRVLAASDIYAAASRWESFDIALGEAMLAGLPCAATDIPGHRDLLKDGVTGLVVPPDDPAALAGAIERLMDDPALGRKLGQEAAAHVGAEFSMMKMSEGYGKIYRELSGLSAEGQTG